MPEEYSKLTLANWNVFQIVKLFLSWTNCEMFGLYDFEIYSKVKFGDQKKF